MSSRTAAILGTGLIGSSIGIGLRGMGWVVRAWDPDPAALEAAQSVGALDVCAVEATSAVDGADLVILAGPVDSILENLRGIATDALVTDVGGVKSLVIDASRGLARFVGGHPMAGRETSGALGASGSLFHGATWVLTEDGATAGDLETMRALVESLGAIPFMMSAVDHDAAVALSSHLPHMTAAALVAALSDDDNAYRLAAGGFRDLTRVALSEPGWWIDVLVANRVEVGKALRSMASRLSDWAALLEGSDRDALRILLADARRLRTGMAAPVASLGVLLADQPGEIGRVGHALSESGVDLRDLQLRHATHGGGGVLTLSVRAVDRERLQKSLIADGFRLIESA